MSFPEVGLSYIVLLRDDLIVDLQLSM